MNISENTVKCPNCLISIVFKDVSRTDNQTRGVYECPECKRNELL